MLYSPAVAPEVDEPERSAADSGAAPRGSAAGTWERWRPRLATLCDEIRRHTRDALLGAVQQGDLSPLARTAAQGAGDVTFGLDLPSESWIARWSEETARREPLSVLTEDRGWRHLGPGSGGRVRELPGFDHGGPRIAFDPVDGTRNLMFDLRSAWTVVSFAAAGAHAPRFRDLAGGLVSELPTSRARSFRVLEAGRGGPCRIVERALADGALLSAGQLVADGSARADHGYFPFFRYDPRLRPHLAALEAAFFARLEAHEGADLRSVWDDQYISNAGQLVLLAQGTYRMVVDARALVGRRAQLPTVTTKPYDVAGALLCAHAAGAVVTRADGSALDFPIDATTPLDMAGYANAATRARLEPHWLAVLAAASPGT